jgi:hypothetical protein
MKAQSSMRPQDIVILLKMLTIQDAGWQYRGLAASLFISISEVSDSLVRSHVAGLVDESKRHVHRQSLMEFLEYGIRYVFPQVPGSMVTGIPTAHSHAFYKQHFSSEFNYVWPDEDGDIRGLAIQPLHKGVPKACGQDELLYKLLASIDVLRVGRAREKELALKQLKKAIL